MGLTAPEHPIYVPQTMEDLIRPLHPGTASQPLLQSSSAVPQMPAEEEPPSSYAGDLIPSVSSTAVQPHTSSDFCYGSTSDSQSGPYYYESLNEDEDLVIDDTKRMLNNFGRYWLY
jgi:hypothetical protein